MLAAQNVIIVTSAEVRLVSVKLVTLDRRPVTVSMTEVRIGHHRARMLVGFEMVLLMVVRILVWVSLGLVVLDRTVVIQIRHC